MYATDAQRGSRELLCGEGARACLLVLTRDRRLLELGGWADSSGRRNTRYRGGCDGQAEGVGSESDGPAGGAFAGAAPAGRREHRVRFWTAIRRGVSSVEAAVEAGVSEAVGVRWFREGGGMPSVTVAALSGRYLSFAEREEIALLRAQKLGVREIARRIGRSPSTISRELRRNAGTRSGSLTYRASTAQWHADRRGRRPKPGHFGRSVVASVW